MSLFGLQHRPSILCICEHWLNISECEYYKNWEYLNLASIWCRYNYLHGGTAIYVDIVNSNYKHEDLDLSEFCIEFDLELAVVHLTVLGWIVVSVYRSPSDGMDNFLTGMDCCLRVLTRLDVKIFLFGD